MNKKRNWIDVLLGGLFVFAFILFLLKMKAIATNTLYEPEQANSAIKGEAYDPELARLRSVSALKAYCDSLQQRDPSASYPEILAEVMTQRFYHGYSYYSVGNNPVSVLLEPVIKKGINAIVIPDDIMKYAYAACSQQSIVAMEILKEKGFEVRKVSMFDPYSQGGHFAFEAYYDSAWHFFDTNQEPDPAVLRQYGRPSSDFLKHNPHIVALAYHERTDTALFQHLLGSSEPGPVNVYPAPNALIYQQLTKFLTNFSWVIILLLIMLRWWWKKKRKTNTVQTIQQ